MSSPLVVKQNTYSVLKKDRSVIEKKIIEALKISQNPSNYLNVLDKAAGKRVEPRPLGKGEYGFVLAGAIMGKKSVAIKFSKELKHEYKVMELLNKHFIFVPKPYYLHTGISNAMYYEFANGGTLEGYMDNLFYLKDTKLIKDTIRSLITQVIYSIYECQQLDPSFRHNDLHLQNVIVSKSGKKTGYSKYKVGKFEIARKNVGALTLLHDFSFTDANIIPNYQVRRRRYVDYGIVSGSNPIYDVHFFLNSMYRRYEDILRFPAFADAKAMILRCFKFDIKNEYLQVNSRFVHNLRLLNVKTNYVLPTVEQVLRDSYFRKVESNARKLEKEKIAQMLKFTTKPKNVVAPTAKSDIAIRRCMRLKKDEIISKAKGLGFNTTKKTKEKMCIELKSRFKI